MKTVVLLFHPDMQHSLVNKKLVEAADQKRSVTIRDMYALYRGQPIDVDEERRILVNADRVVLQFPLKWYDAPTLVQRWKEAVFDDYWLHSGKSGQSVLANKELLLAVAYSEPSYDFTRNGKYRTTINELLKPFQVLSIHLGMQFCQPFTIYELDDLQKSSKEYAEMIVKEDLPIQK